RLHGGEVAVADADDGDAGILVDLAVAKRVIDLVVLLPIHLDCDAQNVIPEVEDAVAPLPLPAPLQPGTLQHPRDIVLARVRLRATEVLFLTHHHVGVLFFTDRPFLVSSHPAEGKIVGGGSAPLPPNPSFLKSA